MYKFFGEHLTKRNIYLIKEEINRDAIILSLDFCYYLKLPTNKIRSAYIKEIKQLYDKIPFLKVPERESDFIINEILKGKKGFAKNKALTENLFCEFIYIK